MDIEIAKDRLFQSKQSMELSDLVTGKPIGEDVKLAIETIDTVLNYIEELEETLKCTQNSWYKTCEELEKQNKEYKEYLKRLDELNRKDFIFKSEIRDKIEILERLQKNFPKNEELKTKAMVLKELLEE